MVQTPKSRAGLPTSSASVQTPPTSGCPTHFLTLEHRPRGPAPAPDPGIHGESGCCVHTLHTHIWQGPSRVRSSGVRQLRSGSRGWGRGEEVRPKSSSVIRSYASRGPGSVSWPDRAWALELLWPPAAAGAMEAVPEPSAHAGEAETAGGASR